MQYFYYLCSEFMDKKTIYYIVEWVVALAACVWLVWKMVTYDHYAALWETMRTMDASRVCALLICIALMPVNMSIEAWRWRTLIPMSWYEAHRQVYYSKLAGLITPWRLGEYPARALLRNEWAQTLSMGAVGSATMTMAIVIGGLVGLGVLGILGDLGNLGNNGEWWIAVAAVVVLLTLGLGLAPRLLNRWATVSHRLVAISVGQSLVRLGCWCVQLGLILFALGALGDPDILGGLGKCAVYYLLVTITPNVPIAEVGVRGAWAITVFGTMNAAFAGVLLWGINTLLPCMGWFFFKKK